MKQMVVSLSVVFVFTIVQLSISSTMAKAVAPFQSHSTALTANSISGQVWNPYNQPIPNIYVELLNELHITVGRYRTSSGGLYQFTNITSGSFKVRVLTNGTDYEEQTKDVQIINIYQGASDQQIVDFRLKFDPRKIVLGSGGLPEEVFAQEIPDAARKLYRQGVDQLSKNQSKGLDVIEQSLQVYPMYFDALNRLGREYVQRREYQRALPYLIKAIDVNQRSFTSFYDLAYSCYQLNQKTEAVEAARAATIIKPGSLNAQLLYGTVLRLYGDYIKSEKALIKAKDLGKKSPVAEVFMQLALLYNKMGRNTEAATELESYLKLSPKAQNTEQIKDLIAKLRNTN